MLSVNLLLVMESIDSSYSMKNNAHLWARLVLWGGVEANVGVACVGAACGGGACGGASAGFLN